LTTKNTTALATLVVALPAALLGFFLVGSFLRQLDPLQKQGTMYVALYGTTLAACAAMVFLPLGVLIFGPRAAKAGEAPKSGTVKAPPKSGTVAAAPPTSAEQPVPEELTESTGEEEAVAPKKTSRPMSTGELEVVEPTPSMDEIPAYDDEVMPKSGEVPAAEMDEDFAIDDEFAADDEPKPAKKKGK